MESFLDKTFKKFRTIVLNAIYDGHDEIFFAGQTLKVRSDDPKSVNDLLLVYINDSKKPYDLNETYENECLVSVEGFLGKGLIEWGKNGLMAIAARKKREEEKKHKAVARKAYDRLVALWGEDLAPTVWRMRIHETGNERITRCVKALLAAPAEAMQAKEPRFAKRLGANLPHVYMGVNGDDMREWETIKTIAQKLAVVNARPAKTKSNETKKEVK